MNELVHKDADFFSKLEHAIVYSIQENPDSFHFVEMPLVHRLTHAMYSRQITMPPGTHVVSERHLTENQFILSQGIVSVWTEEEGEKIIQAPYHGVTKPGTKRALYIHPEGGDAIWTTFHPTLLTTVEEIYDTLVEKYTNPLLEGRFKNNQFIAKQDELIGS